MWAAEGKIVTVKYHELIPMLLNELQQHGRMEQQNRRLVEQHQQIEALMARIAELEAK